MNEFRTTEHKGDSGSRRLIVIILIAAAAGIGILIYLVFAATWPQQKPISTSGVFPETDYILLRGDVKNELLLPDGSTLPLPDSLTAPVCAYDDTHQTMAVIIHESGKDSALYLVRENEARQIAERAMDVCVSPDGSALWYMAYPGKNEQTGNPELHLWKNGTDTMLTKRTTGTAVFSAGGSRILYDAMDRQDGKERHVLYACDTATGESTQIAEGRTAYRPLMISDDGGSICYVQESKSGTNGMLQYVSGENETSLANAADAKIQTVFNRDGKEMLFYDGEKMQYCVGGEVLGTWYVTTDALTLLTANEGRVSLSGNKIRLTMEDLRDVLLEDTKEGTICQFDAAYQPLVTEEDTQNARVSADGYTLLFQRDGALYRKEFLKTKPSAERIAQDVGSYDMSRDASMVFFTDDTRKRLYGFTPKDGIVQISENLQQPEDTGFASFTWFEKAQALYYMEDSALYAYFPEDAGKEKQLVFENTRSLTDLGSDTVYLCLLTQSGETAYFHYSEDGESFTEFARREETPNTEKAERGKHVSFVINGTSLQKKEETVFLDTLIGIVRLSTAGSESVVWDEELGQSAQSTDGTVHALLTETGLLYLMKDGEAEQIATDVREVLISADGTTLAYATGGIYAEDAKDNPRELLLWREGKEFLVTKEAVTEAALSPNGDTLLYTKDADTEQVLICDRDGTPAVIDSVASEGKNGICPLFAADEGAWLYYVKTVDEEAQLYVSDGETPLRLGRLDAANSDLYFNAYGTELLFYDADTEHLICYEADAGAQTAGSAAADNAALTMLLSAETGCTSREASAAVVHAPGVTTLRGAFFRIGEKDAAVFRLGGDEAPVLETVAEHADSVLLCPDGHTLLYSDDETGIYRIDADAAGKEPEQLAEGAFSVWSYAPKSGTLVYVTKEGTLYYRKRNAYLICLNEDGALTEQTVNGESDYAQSMVYDTGRNIVYYVKDGYLWRSDAGKTGEIFDGEKLNRTLSVEMLQSADHICLYAFQEDGLFEQLFCYDDGDRVMNIWTVDKR